MDTVWEVPSPNSLLLYDTEGGRLVFDLRSRQTHLLSDNAAEILTLLRQAPGTLDSLAASFELDPQDHDKTPLIDRLDEILRELDTAGLVEPQP